MKETREFKNEYIKVQLFDKGRTLNRTYDFGELDSVLQQIPFSLVNIPVFAYRNEYTNNDDNRGNFICGWISSYDSELRTFEICILEKYADIIDKYGNDCMIYPRVRFIGNNVVGVIGFDFCEKKYYSVINR